MALVAACGEFGRGSPAAEPAPGALLGAATPTWNDDVAPLLYAQCGSCHAPGGPGATSAFVLTGSDDATDYDVVVALVTGDDANASPLLAKARGDEGHGGGSVLPADSAAYALLLAWVGSGTP